MRKLKFLLLTLLSLSIVFYSCSDSNSNKDLGLSTAYAVHEYSVDGVKGVIDEIERTVEVTFPYGSDITDVAPRIVVSVGATVSPESGKKVDLTDPKIYTVTAEDGTKKEFTAIGVIGKNKSVKVTKFEFEGVDHPKAEIILADRAINVLVPAGTDITTLIPKFTHEGKSMKPVDGKPTNFTKPQKYTITAEDDKVTAVYTVTVTVDILAEIQTFKLKGIDDAVVTIAGTEINVVVPEGTDVTQLIPIVTHTGESISPETGIATDFTQSVVYELATKSGIPVKYTVTVIVAEPVDQLEIENVSKTILSSKTRTTLQGVFGLNGTNEVYLVDSNNKAYPAKIMSEEAIEGSTASTSLTISIRTNDTGGEVLPAGKYDIKVVTGGNETTYQTKKIEVIVEPSITVPTEGSYWKPNPGQVINVTGQGFKVEGAVTTVRLYTLVAGSEKDFEEANEIIPTNITDTSMDIILVDKDGVKYGSAHPGGLKDIRITVDILLTNNEGETLFRSERPKKFAIK